MNTETKPKYKLVKKTKRDGTLWIDQNGELYIADHSGDGNGRHGKPTETDDGPLRIVTPIEIWGRLGTESSGFLTGKTLDFWTKVVVVRREDAARLLSFPAGANIHSVVCISIEIARYLSETYGIPLKIETPAGDYLLSPVKPTEAGPIRTLEYAKRY